MRSSLTLWIVVVSACIVTCGLPGSVFAQCEDVCTGQGNATLLMRTHCDLGSVVKFRIGGGPNLAYNLLRDLGAGPTTVPGVGTYCLDRGPDLQTVASGNLSNRGFGAVYSMIPDDPALIGEVIAYQLEVMDPVAPNGIAISNGYSMMICPLDTGGDECPPCVGIGCTPGYWKNHPESWGLTGFDPMDAVGSVFAIPECLAACDPDLGTTILIEALDFPGGDEICGGARILLRAAVAGLLNASHPDLEYPRTLSEVITDTDAALASCDRDMMIDLGEVIDNDNNLGCTLGNGEDPVPLDDGVDDDDCYRGIVMLEYIHAVRYEGAYPADVVVRVYAGDDPSDLIGEVAFSYDPLNPPMLPLASEGLCINKISAHTDVLVIFGVVDASNYGEGKLPDTTSFEVSIGDVVSVRDIVTSCDEPIGTGFKFAPVFVSEVFVTGPKR